MFSCEFYKISKNTYSYRTPPVAASDSHNFCWKLEKSHRILLFLNILENSLENACVKSLIVVLQTHILIISLQEGLQQI